jgi:signal transduction histidine kinase
MLKIVLHILLLLPICSYSQNYKTEIDSLNAKAKHYLHSDIDTAFYFAEKAIKKSKINSYKEGEMEGEFQIGRIYYDQARRTLAMQAGENSLAIAEEIDSYIGKKNALNLIAKVQNHANELVEGIKTVRRNFNLAKAQGDSIEMALMANFKGIFKNKMGEKDSAFYFTMQSMMINKRLNLQKALAYNYNSLGVHHYGLRNLDSSFYYFRKSLKIRTDLKLPNQSIEAYNNLGYVFLMEGITDSAIVYFKKCIDVCLEYGKKQNLAIAYTNISEAYEVSGNHKSALIALQNAIPINDSLAGIKRKEQIIRAQKVKNEELLILNVIEKDAKQKQLVLIIALIASLILTLIISKRAKNKSIETLIEKQKTIAATEIIKEQEKVREEISQELHDGVGGSLAGVKLSLAHIQEENNSSLLLGEIENIENIYQEIRNISHNLSPVSFQKNSLATTIENYLNRTLPDMEMGLCFQCYPEQEITNLNYDQKICVYRIIQELASNIQKHAFATNVNITITGHGKHLTIIAEDNGKGFNPELITYGIGFKNIQKRITLYDGTIEIDAQKGNGTTIIIELPYKKPRA